ncbi:MAG: hypothetical protein LGR52_08755 [Candidatus Thiosymbion ectosymbiont of Robbea hypermnestra]|nr:hypothetical protein [Candidatus Thiosymbion ectosymbiont of Robbea hypermnestra]
MGRRTHLFSPQFHFAGDQQIEEEIVANIASYGRQLGILSEVVLALAEGKKSDKLGQLKDTVGKIEGVKEKHSGDLEREIETRLEQLKDKDQGAFEKLIDKHHNS